ncbi:hypothetical protein PFMALIP_06282, partial [Plasmodium falciparum MaliPS096_E11]
MAPQNGVGGGGSSGGGEDGIEDKDAKHLLDSIGKKVHEKAEKEAKERSNGDLKGFLTGTTIFVRERDRTLDPCTFKYTELIKANSNRYPCGNESVSQKRFSVKQQAEYDNKKMKCSNGGACAPYRRLHLCDKNLETISNYDSNAKDKLLLEVCYAAKYEGDSIKTRYIPYQQIYGDSPSQICTVLARSFADIGDIVRGRDLYSGNKKEKNRRDELEKNLNKIFNDIKNKNKTKLGELTLDKVREYWWEENRETVWKAITCDDDDKLASASYFRETCAGGTSPTHKQCRCRDNQVPTYFDYVPQYLRWFEEWAEDFCRKKNKKIKDVKRNCREKYKSGTERYCSRNGFDCEQTISRIGKVRMGKGCTDCFFACHSYENWIDNQRKQFLKQKEQFEKQKQKYTDEINGTSSSSGSRKKRDATTTNYDGYEKKFYDIFETKGGVDKFLEKLSNEEICKKITEKEEGKIDFKNVKSSSDSGGTSDASGTNDENKGTFYRSKYCQPCPDCGVKHLGNGNFQDKETKGKKCEGEKLYEPKSEDVGTPIRILKSGENHDDIETKLKAFCAETNSSSGGRRGDSGTSGSNELYEEWKCYEGKDVKKVKNGEEEDDEEDVQEVKDAGGLCILKKKKEESQSNSQNNHADIQKTFHDFFYYWVAHMLKDSVHWRTKRLKSCISNGAKIRCKNKEKCNRECGCFQKWVDQKKEKEWKPIKKHFYTQKDICKETSFMVINHHYVLKTILEDEFYKEKSEDASTEDNQNSLDEEEAEELKRIREIIEKKKKEEEAASGVGVVPTCDEGAYNEQKNPIDYLLDEELDDATKCKQDCEQRKAPAEEGVAKTGQPLPPAVPTAATKDTDDDDDEEDDDDFPDEVEEQAAEAAKTEVVEETVAEVTEVETVKPPCDIVADLFKDTSQFSDACGLKYGKNNSRLGWKCIPTSGGEKATGGAVTTAPSSGKSDGSICVPPRRRKLYIDKIKDWADKQSSQESGNTVVSEASPDPTPEPSRAQSGTVSEAPSQLSTVSEAPSQSSSSSSTPSPSHSRDDDALRDAFIESAAVETFFLWDRYKKIKDKEKKEKEENGGLLGLDRDSVDSGGEETPETSLKSGNIPPDFLRQMFYTLGDYRDICVGNTPNGIDTVSASGDNKSGNNIKEISGKIDTILKKQSSPPNGGPQNSVNETQSSDKRTNWWENNAKDIWQGMICALTYKESDEKGTQQITQDTQLKEAFFGKENTPDKPANPVPPVTAATPTGTYEKNYKYETVKLDDTSDTQAKTKAPASGENTHLSKFVLRPPYFRYLEEWGETFCRKRTYILKKVKKECDGFNASGTKIQCSGDGHDCEKNSLKHHKMFEDSLCSGCYEQCRKYRKWIDIKFEEFHNQKNKYEDEYGKIKANSSGNGDNKNFYTSIKDYTSVDKFLSSLKHCKDGQTGGEKNKIDFENPETTFGPLEYCKTCPIYGVNCNGNKRGRNECSQNGQKWKEVFDKIPKNNGTCTDITVEMIDRRGAFIKEYLNNLEQSKNSEKSFKDSYLFKSLRTEEWECRYKKDDDMDICKLDKFEKNIDLNDYTTFKVLLIYWLDDFLYGYYILKKKIDLCTENGENTCDANSKNDCACVKAWVEQKQSEWKKINDHFKKRKHKDGDGNDMKSSVRQLLETLIPRMDLANDKAKVTELSDLERSLGCNCAENSKSDKEGEKKDIVECLFQKLEDKAKKCSTSTSGEKQTCENSTTLDDDEPLEEENPVGKHPSFCNIEKKAEPENEGGCDPATTEAAEKPAPPAPSEGTDHHTEVKPEEKATVPAGTPPSTPATPAADHPQADEPSKPIGDILSSTIPFGIAI